MSSEQLADICFNFTHGSFRNDEASVLQRAIDAGVTTLIVTASNIPESRECVALAQKYPKYLYATVGVHPHLAREWDSESPRTIRQLAAEHTVKAIGECGLDYNRDFSPREKQRYALEAQLELAAELGLPVFLHERDAHGDFLEIMARYRPHLKCAVIHCFTGTESQLKACLELDLHVGITGWICDERRGHHLRDFIGIIPTNRLMIETDAPYLVPRDLKPQPKGRRNEPAFLPHICMAVASARGADYRQTARETAITAYRFFGVNDPGDIS